MSHSTLVDLQLEVDGQTLSLSQVSRDWVMAQSPCDLAPCDGVVVMTIDGRKHASSVRLPQGMSKDEIKTPVQRLA